MRPLNSFSKIWREALLSSLLMAGWTVEAESAAPVPGAGSRALSVFILPTSPAEGCDPFFPNSPRPYEGQSAPGTKTQEVDSGLLVLQGISGLPSRRFVIINKHTFAAGDVSDVLTSRGRLSVKCLEIKSDSVVVEVGGQRHELRYKEKP
jgi:hypothetical protein